MNSPKRLIPLDIPALDPLPELMTVEEVATRWGKHPNTIRRWIAQDMRDGMHRVPGGRREGSSIVIVRAVFERAMRDGIEPAPRPIQVAPAVERTVAALREEARRLDRLADELTDLHAQAQPINRGLVRFGT